MKRSLLLAMLLSASVAKADLALVDHSGERLPISELRLVNENGIEAPLADIFRAGHPVLLTPVYYGCAGLCTLTLNHLVESLRLVSASPGRGFEVVAVSILPEETSALALAKKQALLATYGRPESATGWHFLTGSGPQVKKLTDALGFPFARESAGLVSHPSALYVLDRSGRITATLPGPNFTPREIRAALANAEAGRVQRILNRVSALCYAYLPHPGPLSSPERWLALGMSLVAGIVAWQWRRKGALVAKTA